MTTYILLRSNRESGPFTLDQLKEQGLKSDDLIWVEGQSACWRNPHEIRELRDLPEKQVEKPVNVAVERKEYVATTKKVFVSLPLKQGTSKPDHPVTGVKAERDETFLKPKPVANKVVPGPAHDDIPYPEVQAKEELETKFTMSLDEIKERYVKSLESKSKPARARTPIAIPKKIREIAMYAGVFILGAAIVLLLVRPNVLPVSSEQKRLPGPLETRPAEEVAGSALSADDEIVMPDAYYDSGDRTNAVNSDEVTSIPAPAQKSNLERNRIRGQEPVVSLTRDEEPQDNPADEKISVPKNEEAGITRTPRADLSSEVSVRANQYTIAALGGIRDLELTVANNSEYVIDQVSVQVRYLNPNGNVVRTEDIHFRSLHPNGSQTIALKKSNRGVKVDWKIIRIESRDAGLVNAGTD